MHTVIVWSHASVPERITSGADKDKASGRGSG